MFCQYSKSGMFSVPSDKIDKNYLTAGYVTVDELAEIAHRLGFDASTVDACRGANRFFRSGVEVYKDYTFTELRILNGEDAEDDFIALYLRKNLILVVDVEDTDGSTKDKFLAATKRYQPESVCAEKILCAFLDSLLTGDNSALESIGNDLADQEDEIFENQVDRDFNTDLLELKKQLSRRFSYYEQLLDITEAVSENDNGVFAQENLIYIDNVSKRISRLRDDTSSLKSSVEHLQDAYSSYLDIRMNNTMKIFTILTSIFFPLTIIVGWYGMNFRYMPELEWKFGYVYVIVLSIVTVAVLAIIGKRKKWF